MAEDENRQPGTLDELEQQLDKDEPVVQAIPTPPADMPPPNPRESGGIAAQRSALPPEVKDDISENDLEDAGTAAEEADEDEEPQLKLRNGMFHREDDPNAPRPQFWKRPKFWLTSIFIVLVTVALAWFIKPSRDRLVNMLGLRARVSISTVTLPDAGQKSSLLKNVAITIGGVSVQTNDQGVAQADVPYGDQPVVAKKAGYQDATQTAALDFDPFFHLLGGKAAGQSALTLQLKAVGIPLKFTSKDWLTGAPITGGSFSVGDAVAKPDDQGVINITIPATDAKTIQVKSSLGGTYTDKQFEVPLDGTSPTITFVPAGRDYFVSNRGGSPAVYGADLDGANATSTVAASPNETAGLNITVSPDGRYAAMVSTRDAKRDDQGTLLQQLYIIDLSSGSMTAVDQAKWINFVDWAHDTLVYTVGEHQPGAASLTQRLASADATSAKHTNLGTASAYGMVRVAIDSVAYQIGQELRVVPIRGGTEKSLGTQVQLMTQPDFDRFDYQTADGAWHEYNVNTSQNKNTSAPSSLNRAFLATASSDQQNRLLVDKIDGKPTLVVKNIGSGQEKTLYSDANITGPVRLVGNVVIFRMGSADYALALSGGAPKKITDVSVPIAPVTKAGDYFTFF